MPGFTDPRTGLQFFFSIGDNDWGPAFNANWQHLAYFGTHLIIKGVASDPPASPAEHNIYIVDNAPTGAWASFTPGSLAVYGRAIGSGSSLTWFQQASKDGWVGYRDDTTELVVHEAGTWSGIGGLTPAQKTKLDGIAAGAQVNRTIAEIATGLNALTTGKISYNSLADVPTSVGEANVNADWDATTGDAEILNKPDLSGLMTTAERNKLTGIEAGAQVNRTFAEEAVGLNALAAGARVSYNSLDNTPTTITPAQTTKLAGIEANATADQTAAEIIALLEGVTNEPDKLSATAIKNLPTGGGASFSGVTTDTTITGDGDTTALSVANPFTAADETKLDGIAAGAQVNYTYTQMATRFNTTANDAEKIDYDNLKNQPVIMPGGAAQVQADYGVTDTSSVAYIKRKPDLTGLLSVAERTKLTGIEAGAQINVQSDFAVELSTDPAYIKNRPQTITQSERNHLAGIEAGAQVNLTAQQTAAVLNLLPTGQKIKYSAIDGTPTSLTSSVTTDSTIDGDGRTTPLSVANPFTSAYQSKLDGIAAGAQVNQTIATIIAAANARPAGSRISYTSLDNVPSAPSGTFAGVTTDSTLTGKGTGATDQLRVANPFTSADSTNVDKIPAIETKLDTIETGANVTKFDSLWATILQLAVNRSTEQGTSINVVAAAKELTRGSTFEAGSFTVLESDDYDPIYIDDDYFIALPNVNVGRTLVDGESYSYTLYADGQPRHNIRLGRTSNDRLLIGLASSSDTAFSETFFQRRLSAKTVANPLDAEGVQDIVGGMIGSTDGITVTYDDPGADLDFVLDAQTDGATLAGAGSSRSKLRISDEYKAKINQAFDLVRIVDDEFTFTAGTSQGNIGWIDGVAAQGNSLVAFGTIDGGNNPQFNAGGTIWQVGGIWLDGTDLEVRFFAKPATPATIPDLPQTIDIKLGTRIFRATEADVQNITSAEAGAGHAYIQMIWRASSTLFASGDMVTGQILLAGADISRLVPLGGSNSDVLTRDPTTGVPTWLPPTGGGGGGGSGDDIVKQYTSNTQAIISSATLNYILDTVTLSTAQKQLRDTTEWKISHYLKVNIKVGTSGNFRLAIWPTGSTTALTTTTYEALPTTATDKELKIDVPASAGDGYRAVLEFDQVIGNVTIENVTSTSMVVGVSSGAAYTNEQARDAVGNALVAGESQSDIDTTRRDIGNTIELNIKPNVITFAMIKKLASDTTIFAEQAFWRTALGITQTPVVPQPVTLPELYITRSTRDPANVLTIRDTRGYLNETLLVGTTLNLFKGGTAMSQTGVAGSPFTITARLSGGYRSITQRVRINKNVTFASSASPVNSNTFNVDVYYLVVGSRPAAEDFDFHAFDASESFDLDVDNQMARATALNSVRNLISVIDGGTTKRHYAYDTTTGGVENSVYTQTLEGNPQTCGWDPDGRHLYVADDNLFRVYDFGASTTPTTLTISRVNSKEFSVSDWFFKILGIGVTATEVLVLGQRYPRATQWSIDRFNKTTGVRNTALSDINFFSQGGGGFVANSDLTQYWSAALDGDHVEDLTSRQFTPQPFQGRGTFDIRLKSGLSIYRSYRISIYNHRLYFGNTSTPVAYELKDSNNTTFQIAANFKPGYPSGSDSFNGGFVYGKFFYSVIYLRDSSHGTNRNKYLWMRSDQSAATATLRNPVLITGSIDYWDNGVVNFSAIIINRLYYRRRVSGVSRLYYRQLTGTIDAGYTAMGAEVEITTTGESLHSKLNDSSYFRMWADDTRLFMASQSDNSSISILTVATNVVSSFNLGGIYGGCYDRQSKMHFCFRTTSSTNYLGAYDFSGSAAITCSRNRRTSFPLGTRQTGPIHGIAYNPTNSKFYIPNTNKVNVYDKTVTNALRHWVRNEATDMSAYGMAIAFIGSFAYVKAGDLIRIYHYPDFVYTSQITINRGSRRFSEDLLAINDRLYVVDNGSDPLGLQEIAVADGELIGSKVSLTGTNRYYVGILYDGTYIRAYAYNRAEIFPMYPRNGIISFLAPTTGGFTSTTLSRVATEDIQAGDANDIITMFIYNGFLFAGTRVSSSLFRFLSYNLTSKLYDANNNISFGATGFFDSNSHVLLKDNVLYLQGGNRWRAWVRSV